MTAPSFDADMTTWLATGAPLLDNAAEHCDPDPEYDTCEDCGDRTACLSRRGLCVECDELAEESAA